MGFKIPESFKFSELKYTGFKRCDFKIFVLQSFYHAHQASDVIIIFLLLRLFGNSHLRSYWFKCLLPHASSLVLRITRRRSMECESSNVY